MLKSTVGYTIIIPEMPRICPWGAGKVDLREVELTAAQKNWLADRIVSKATTVAKLAHKYNLPEHRLKKYATKLRNGGLFQDQGGRPRLLTPEVV